MLNLGFHKRNDEAVKILCLGAHCDDIEIGCGGTILKLLERHNGSRVYWFVISSDPQRAVEARRSADLFLQKATSAKIVISDFKDGFFPYVGAQIKELFENLKQQVSPDLIFTHYRNDLHQDHRVVSELTWNTFRDHLILEYEIPKYDGDLGSPNVFVPLDRSLGHRKIEAIMTGFPSQVGKRWFDEDLFRSMLRLRGMECNASADYAEAFYCRKLVVA